jgi:hypothetical protein
MANKWITSMSDSQEQMFLLIEMLCSCIDISLAHKKGVQHEVLHKAIPRALLPVAGRM